MAKQADTRRPPVDLRLRVGVIAGDPLRMLGFQSLFADHIVIAIVPIGDAEPLESLATLGIDLVVVAAQNTSQVFEAIRDIRAAAPEMRLIVMAAHHEREFIDRVLRVGAHGYLTATAARTEIEEAIAQVYDGKSWTPLHGGRPALPVVAAASMGPSGTEGYTERELQVLDLLHTGQSNREIAVALRIEERTVKSHVARLLKKMGVRNRTALIMQAIGQNLVGNTLR